MWNIFKNKKKIELGGDYENVIMSKSEKENSIYIHTFIKGGHFKGRKINFNGFVIALEGDYNYIGKNNENIDVYKCQIKYIEYPFDEVNLFENILKFVSDYDNNYSTFYYDAFFHDPELIKYLKNNCKNIIFKTINGKIIDNIFCEYAKFYEEDNDVQD